MLRLESLRPRVTLDGSGLGVSDPLPWFDPGALTYSFAPDGTRVAGYESSLFEQLSVLGDPTDWQSEFDEAFNAWLTPLGVTTRQVSDSGSRFGVSGRTQGDSRFGDVRIAAIPLSDNVLATSVPHSAMVQGTWAGDILVNANATWNSLHEVFAVAMHEFGHVLGLGHSSDPSSPLFVHGVHDAHAPTTADIDALRDLYVGIQFEEEDADGDSEESDSNGEGEAEEEENNPVPNAPHNLPVDAADAVALKPSIGTTLRYSAVGDLAAGSPGILYRLEPTPNEAEELENLVITLQTTGLSRLVADIAVFDQAGRRLESHILHHGQGSVVVQTEDVDSDQTHYVFVTPSVAAPLTSQAGSFEIRMDLAPELRASSEIGRVQLNEDVPVIDLDFSVSSSRLVHIHLNSEQDLDLHSAVFGQLLDASGHSLMQIAMRPGTSRSAPLTFLAAGDYTLRLSLANDSVLQAVGVTVSLSEVSIDVGPGVSDPTGQPFLACDEPGADPDFCYVYLPITPDAPTVPETPPARPDADFPWWFEFGFDCGDYTTDQLDFAREQDPLWWEFHTTVCQPITDPSPTPPDLPPPSGPSPNDPVANDPSTNEPIPNDPPQNPPASPPTSPWQNRTNRFDVSANQIVTAQDALMVINTLGRHVGGTVAVSGVTNVYADVNGDFLVSALDALHVINSLARQRLSAEPETTIFSAPPPNDEEQVTETDLAIGQLF